MASNGRWIHLLGASRIKDRIRSDESLAIPDQTRTTSASYSEVSSHAVKRIASIDIFRGLNVMLMIFVNNLSVVAGLPWWTYHRGDVNGMTYVDMVFPGFLFLMGMSIPLSLEARVARGQSKAAIWAHVVARSLSLVVLGLFLANAPHVDASQTHMSKGWWAVLGLMGIALAWMRFPGEDGRKVLYQAIRYAGLVVMAVLFVMFRRVTPEGQVAGLDLSYWEILGLLGWAYLLVSALYLLIRKRIKILVAAFAVMVVLNTLSMLGLLNRINTGPLYWNPFEAGLSSLTMAGVLASFVILGNTLAPTFRQKAYWILGAAAMLFAVGYALQPLGISKNRDTPTWCLYCTAANLLIALLLLWIADVKGWRAWASFAKPAGENPLLPYFLADIPYFPQLYWMTAIGTSGSWGVLRATLLTGLVLVVSGLLMRFGVRLRV
jgi:heparan-alpha-glucosaminide N-acetyltransferase